MIGLTLNHTLFFAAVFQWMKPPDEGCHQTDWKEQQLRFELTSWGLIIFPKLEPNMVHVYNCHPFASQQIVQVSGAN